MPRIEAGLDGWYWGVPLPDGTYNTLVFVDPNWFRSAPGATLSERLLRLIERSGLMEDCRDAGLIAPVRAIDATPYLAIDCVAANRIRGLQGIEWVILRDHSGGSMHERTLRRRYSSSRNP